MKSLLIKVAGFLLLAFFLFGVVQYSNAAFVGKHKSESKEILKQQVNPTISENKNIATNPPDDDLILLVILALLLPPLAVYLKYDDAGKPFIVNVILTLLCFLPGMIHALYHVLKK